MKNSFSILAWVSIVGAVACAFAIPCVTTLKPLFLALLLLNLALPFVARKGYGKPALTVCRLLVGALFVFSSFTKGVDPLGTKYKMLDYFAAYGITWLNDLALVLAVFMILAEFLVGICLMTNVFPRLAVLGATLLMVFFTITTLFDALYDLVPDCGCFGSAVKMSNWQTFYKNLVIDAVLIPLVLNNKRLENKFSWGGQFVAGCIFAIAFLGFEFYNYRHLPMVDFMDWKVGKQMNAQPEEAPRIYLKYSNGGDKRIPLARLSLERLGLDEPMGVCRTKDRRRKQLFGLQCFGRRRKRCNRHDSQHRKPADVHFPRPL